MADHTGAKGPLVSVHEHNEESRTAQILGWLESGEDIALVTDAGTPLVSDPGARVVRAVVEAGHEVTPIPGPSAALAALVASGLPAERFVFLGFPAVGLLLNPLDCHIWGCNVGMTSMLLRMQLFGSGPFPSC